jgi:Thioredoxin-like
MSVKNRSTLRVVALCCSLEFLVPVHETLAQEKPATSQQAAPADSPIVVVDTVKIEGGAELTTDEQITIANSLQGETAHADWLARMNATAVRKLQDDGFFDATATGKVESTQLIDGKAHATVRLAVTAGPRYSIQEVWWAGSSIFSPVQLDNLGLLKIGDVFRRSALGETIALIQQAYAERGRQMTLMPKLERYPESGKITLFLGITENEKSSDSKPEQCKQYSAEDMQEFPYVPSLTYDPAIDGQMQIARAELEAQRTNKKLLLIVGDTGCGWCHLLDRTFQRNPATTELRDKLFITVHVDDSNECALKPYPKAFGVPFIYVLDEKGNLLGTEETKDWETGDGYDPRRIDAFLTKW